MNEPLYGLFVYQVNREHPGRPFVCLICGMRGKGNPMGAASHGRSHVRRGEAIEKGSANWNLRFERVENERPAERANAGGAGDQQRAVKVGTA